MSARVRVWVVVGLAATAAAGTVVGVTLATRSDVQRQSSKPPPFAADPTARPEVIQQVREALKAWPAGTARRLRILAARYPQSALVRLELGLALALSGQQHDRDRRRGTRPQGGAEHDHQPPPCGNNCRSGLVHKSTRMEFGSIPG